MLFQIVRCALAFAKGSAAELLTGEFDLDFDPEFDLNELFTCWTP